MAAKKRDRGTRGLITGLSAACLCLAAALAALLVWDPAPVAPRGEPEQTEALTEPAAPAAVLPVVADGDPDSLRCKASYSGEASDPDAVVARLGEDALTAGQLQAYYWLAVCGYRGEGKPDFSRPLEEQLCPLTDEGLSWQHYFLRQALASWELWQGLVQLSREPMPVAEERFQPSAEAHETYFPAGIPAEKVLYADRDCFTPNSVHREYLESLPERLSDLARDRGADSVGALAGARDADVAAAAETMNLAYMFFTEKTWEETAEDALAGDTVSIRQCLLIPESMEEGAWTSCKYKADRLLADWKKHWLTARNSDSAFARLANENSRDESTRADGGLLAGVRAGQLTKMLDSWCFDPARKPGDTAVIRSGEGFHIVYFRGRRTQAEAEEASAALESRIEALTAQARGEAQVDYGGVTLAPVTVSDVSTEALLYPDVGFQRFPEVPLYLQQDYGNLRFGGQYLSIAGCGMCSMAMVATYMTDRVYTPAMIVDLFPYYYGSVGTDGNIFLYGPADLGFYSAGQLRNWEDILRQLQAGNPVVTLQMHGVFTTGGHYMVLSRGYEDGTVTVRDSNLKNYAKLDGYKTDRFTKADVLSGGVLFYAFQPKLVTLPACCRCGEGGSVAEDYVCPKCAAALLRREAFLNLTAGE